MDVWVDGVEMAAIFAVLQVKIENDHASAGTDVAVPKGCPSDTNPTQAWPLNIREAIAMAAFAARFAETLCIGRNSTHYRPV